MDKQSAQPMLGTSASSPNQGLQMEVGDVGRVPSTHSFFKKTRNKGLIIALIIAIVLCIILLIALCISLLSGEELCTTPQCLRAASSILESMDDSVSPCDNFYNFMCGRWKNEHFVKEGKTKNNWFEERNEIVTKLVSDFIKKEDSSDDSDSVIKARMLYRSCMDTDEMELNGLDTLNTLLTGMNMPITPPLKPNKTWNWIENIAKARRLFDLQILIGSTVTKVPTNRSISKIGINIPEKLESLGVKSKKKKKISATEETEEDKEKHQNWKKEVYKFLNYFFMVNGIKVEEEDLAKGAEDILRMERALKMIEEEEDVEEAKPEILPLEMSIRELQAVMKYRGKPVKVRWLDYFQEMFEDTGITDVRSGLERNETILVGNLPYYKHLAEFITTNTNRQLGLFAWWRIVYYLSPHVDSYTFEIRKEVDSANDIAIPEREEFCIDTVTEQMTPALSLIVLQQPNLDEKIEQVTEMINNIKDAFTVLIDRLTWMDDITKIKTKEKVKAMEKTVGIPNWMKDKNKIEEIYENVNFTEDYHLLNMLQLYKNEALDEISDLRKFDDSIGDDLEPLEVNAFYKPQENVIFIPAMILQFPFYDLGLEALNYGAIGVIVGHELTHGFDDSGRLYNEKGNYDKWWTDGSDKEYSNRAQCFINRFGNFHIESINKTVDGNLTLDENLADNGGIMEGIMAYRNYVNTYGEEEKLPGLEKYTHDQLFYMSFGHTWCEEHSGEDSLLEDISDEHSPTFVRILIGLQDSEEFSEVWDCPKGSGMNPAQEKCSLWVDNN